MGLRPYCSSSCPQCISSPFWSEISLGTTFTDHLLTGPLAASVSSQMKRLLILLTLEVRCLLSYYWLQEFFVYSGKEYLVGDVKIFSPMLWLLPNALSTCKLESIYSIYWLSVIFEFCVLESFAHSRVTKGFTIFFSWKIYSVGFIFRFHNPFWAFFCLQWKLWTGIRRFVRCASIAQHHLVERLLFVDYIPIIGNQPTIHVWLYH